MSPPLFPHVVFQGVLVALLLSLSAANAALAQDATPGSPQSTTVHLQEGDVPVGSDSVDTPSGERIGRAALDNHLHRLAAPPPLDAVLDSLAGDQLRAAIDQAATTGTLGAGGRVLRVGPDTLVRLGVVGLPRSDGRANMFSLVGPKQAEAVGSAGGVATLRTGTGADDSFPALVAAVAWRDRQLTPLDDLTATFGQPPRTPDDLDAQAAEQWLDQENRARVMNGFPPDLLARRNPVLDREAENILRGTRGEPPLPPVTDLPAGVEQPGALHANSRTCDPNCDPFWVAPDRLLDAYRQTTLEDHLGPALGVPWTLNFDAYTQQRRWLVRYWDSYRLFGVAAHVRADQEVTAHTPAVRQAVDALAPGAADQWAPREYPVDFVVVGSNPWPD